MLNKPCHCFWAFALFSFFSFQSARHFDLVNSRKNTCTAAISLLWSLGRIILTDASCYYDRSARNKQNIQSFRRPSSPLPQWFLLRPHASSFPGPFPLCACVTLTSLLLIVIQCFFMTLFIPYQLNRNGKDTVSKPVVVNTLCWPRDEIVSISTELMEKLSDQERSSLQTQLSNDGSKLGTFHSSPLDLFGQTPKYVI